MRCVVGPGALATGRVFALFIDVSRKRSWSISTNAHETPLPSKSILVLGYPIVGNQKKLKGIRAMFPRTLNSGLAVLLTLAASTFLPDLAFAQAASPFMTGATALQSNILAWLTPVAIILVMVLGAMAMANRISWGWCIAAVLGIAISFGATQIVTWVRGMFGV